MLRRDWILALAAALALTPAAVVAQEGHDSSGENCSFRVDAEGYLTRQLRVRRDVFHRAGQFGKPGGRAEAGGALTVPASEIPRRGFIDVEIFDRLDAAGVPSARLSSDTEFVRRIHLDLTGRLPSVDTVRAFLEDPSEDKRRALIDRLANTPEFVYKWSVWMGELLQNAQTQSNITREAAARNTYFDWIKYSLNDGKSLKQMAYEALSTSGNTFLRENGAANFSLTGRSPTGPAQDTYDWMLYNATSKFLGVGHYDCLLCHDGRRHLDDLSLWGKGSVRIDAQRMAAFFSRTRLAQNNNVNDAMYRSWTVSEVTTGNYSIVTNFGNRPNRVAVGTLTSVNPEYRDGWKPAGQNWREEFAGKLISDPLFSINLANRIWKEMFNYALIEPMDSIDPDRLDPDQPPPAPWSLQASHPRLLRLLAAELEGRDFNLRSFVQFLAESSAYQLSSRYDGEWNLSLVPLFARHYPRRLEGEEIHDAIVQSTGMFQNYTVAGFAEPVRWAIELPEPAEPRSNGAVNNFMNAFLRGNRSTQFRSQSGSIIQQLALMNDAFVNNRTRVANSPNIAAAARIADNEAAVNEMFLLFLSRYPTEVEKGYAVAHLAKSTNTATRNAAVEDLAWALINKAEFIFSH
jgi:hypothetical protein